MAYRLACKVIYVLVASLAQLLPPHSPIMSNPALDSSLCRAAAPRLRPLAPRLRPLQLLLPVCVCCSSIASASAADPDHIRFGCCSPIASASTAVRPRLRPLRLLLPIACVRLQPQLDSSPMFSNILRGSVNKLKYEVRRSRVTIV